MYYNYYEDLDDDEEYDFGEPWAETYGPDVNDNWEEELAELRQYWT
jgi:hypothetical protein